MKRMSWWTDYREGLLKLNEVLEHLQADKEGFRFPHRPERLNVNPAKLTLLKNLVVFLAESHPVFAPFTEAVTKDYSSPETSPSTFEQPLYHDLHAVIQTQLRGESSQA